MVPGLIGGGELNDRCPRLRGDGPPLTSWSECVFVVSPPTRGWSCAYLRDVRAGSGVPAYAGMVRGNNTSKPCRIRCPRLRGDGPDQAPRWHCDTRVSPPTRGWSASAHAVAVAALGVPAYAGMVRCGRQVSAPQTRCPRLRGDGPPPPSRLHQGLPVSPPTRGWSHGVRLVCDPRAGVPAYAGMVPRDVTTITAKVRCPRLRGDGPSMVEPSQKRGLVSPPTRGWSLEEAAFPKLFMGVPAYAGMVPADAPGLPACLGCPRLRGDGPDLAAWLTPARMVSPPTRGWSRTGDLVAPEALGVPAYAGMVRGQGSRRRRVVGCPRLRGAGPSGAANTSLVPAVAPPTRGWSRPPRPAQAVPLGVPAYAGMVPCPTISAPTPPGCPRLRGDGPSPRSAGRLPASVSPPTRGWSRVSGEPINPGEGVPAYAGMVPTGYRTCRCARWCPRLRGDGPRARVVQRIA